MELRQNPPFVKRRNVIKTLLNVKFIAIFLFAAVVQAGATVHSKKITFAQNSASLKSVLKEIELLTAYSFFYKEGVLRQSKDINIDVKDVSVEDLLDQCFKNQTLSYSIHDKVVVVKPDDPELLAFWEADELKRIH